MRSDCYVYAIVGRGASLPGARSALTMVPCRELAAVTGTPRDDGAWRIIEAVRHHEAIVEAVRRQGPALPVRFGTVFRDAASVAAAIADRYEPLAADLDRLGDKVELSLTALWITPPAVDALPSAPVDGRAPTGKGAGARYLHARLAQLRREEGLQLRARAVVRELDRGLGELALTQRVSLLPTPHVAVRATYLLDPREVNAFKAAFETARHDRGEVRVLLTGPWPPYSFVRRPEPKGAVAPDGRIPGLAQLLTDAMRERLG